MIGVLIRGVVRLVTKTQADKLVSRGIAQKIPTRGQAAAQDAGKKVGTKEFNKLVGARPPKVVKPEAVKPKVVEPKSTTSKYTTSAQNIKTTGGGAKPPAGTVKVTTGAQSAASKRGADLATRMAAAGITKKGGSYFKAGKKLTKKQLIKAAIVPATAVAIGVSTLGKKDVVKKPPQAATTNGKKPPKKPKPDYTDIAGSTLTTLEDTALGENVVSKPKPKAKPKSYEQKLKDKWIKDRGGIDAFKPTTKWGKYWQGDRSGKEVSDSAWSSHVISLGHGEGGSGSEYDNKQLHESIMKDREKLSEKKHGGQVRKKKKKAAKKRPRGVGKALRGYGKASYSSKMY